MYINNKNFISIFYYLYIIEMSDNAPYDDFLYLIDLTIESGDIIYIKNAIIKYENVLSKYYIDWGESNYNGCNTRSN